jgi:hypothetical protein
MPSENGNQRSFEEPHASSFSRLIDGQRFLRLLVVVKFGQYELAETPGTSSRGKIPHDDQRRNGEDGDDEDFLQHWTGEAPTDRLPGKQTSDASQDERDR